MASLSPARPFAERETLSMLTGRKRQLLAALDEVLVRRAWDRNALRAFQTRTLQALLIHAFEKVPFYQAKYTAAGFDPAQFHDLDDLGQIPHVTKAELRNASAEALRAVGRHEPGRLLSSSGSTGTPLNLFREEASLWHFMARNMALYFDWCNSKPIDNVLYFLDLTPGSIDYALADLLRTTVMENRIVAIDQPTAALVEALFQYRPGFVSSYPSTLRNLAIAMQRRSLSYKGLRLLHLTSELLDAGTRTLIGKAFPAARIVETYTSTEAGLIAYQCLADRRMHLAEEGVVFEIVDAAGAPAHGVGEVVVTDLTNWSTPIIRYQGLGDFCRWEETPCTCGSSLASIKQLEGRITESLTLPTGEMLSPYTLIDAVEDLPGIYHFQIIQLSTTQYEIVVVFDEASGSSEDDVRQAVSQALARLIPEAECRVRFVATIVPEAGRHKVPLVVSRVARSV